MLKNQVLSFAIKTFNFVSTRYKIPTSIFEGKSMRLTVKTDYCLRILIYLQKNKGKVKIQEIADNFKISKNHLSVAANTLSELGYILSTSGPKGGIEFNSACQEKSLAELVTRIEDFDILKCLDDTEDSDCVLTSNCRLKGILKKATNAFVMELKNYKIGDLV